MTVAAAGATERTYETSATATMVARRKARRRPRNSMGLGYHRAEGPASRSVSKQDGGPLAVEELEQAKGCSSGPRFSLLPLTDGGDRGIEHRCESLLGDSVAPPQRPDLRARIRKRRDQAHGIELGHS